MAAEQGYVAAQYNLALRHNNGEGVPQNYAEAARWYRTAAVQGHADAQTNLGVMFERGHGTLQDSVTAHMWYNLGGANGNSLGQQNRDSIARSMTPADVSEAQRRARVCLDSGYQDCD
jgi:hypothetical protein